MPESSANILDRTVVWQAHDSSGLEHLRVWQDDGQVVADSVVIGNEEGAVFRLAYRVTLGLDFSFRCVELALGTGRERTLALQRDDDGTWWDGAGVPQPQFAGCFDIDITATPFTNTLPIRRLYLRPGQFARIDVAYIMVPELKLVVDPQRYTCLQQTATGQVFRFGSLANDFVADFTSMSMAWWSITPVCSGACGLSSRRRYLLRCPAPRESGGQQRTTTMSRPFTFMSFHRCYSSHAPG